MPATASKKFRTKTGVQYSGDDGGPRTGGDRMKVEKIAVAIDLGTTHLKCLAVGEGGIPGYQKETSTPFLDEPGVKAPAIDAKAVWRWTRDQLEAVGGASTTVAFSCAMHSLLVVDRCGEPVDGAAYTWMDTRAAPDAWRLRKGPQKEWRERTGTPVHAMSVVVKWLWWQRVHGDVRPFKVVGLKDWIIFQLCGQWLTDWTSASGTGMLGLTTLAWDERILKEVGLESDQLPTVVSPGTRLGFGHGVVVIGGGDAALAHYGLGVDASSGAAVLSLGTSGAIRTNIFEPRSVLSPNFFCYRALEDSQYLLGEAYSNIGNLLAWVGREQGVSVGDLVQRGLIRLHQTANIPLLVPYRFGERSPYWEERLYGEWIGLGDNESPDDFMAGAVAAVITVLYGGSLRLSQAVLGIGRVRSGSKILNDWRLAKTVANVIGHSLSVEEGVDASLLGALRLADAERWHDMTRFSKALRVFEPETTNIEFWQDRAARQEDATKRQLQRIWQDECSSAE